jgi:hypothetical protein
MSEDRVVANTLERATSTDFNAAQAAQSRRLSDWIMAAHADHRAPIGYQNGVGLGPSIATKRAVVTGLNVVAGVSADEIYVGPGTLSQYSEPGDEFTGPAWTGARDPTTNIQTGILRSTTTVPYVSTAGLGLNNNAAEAYHLLCARLQEVVSLTTTVDIFDVPTQAFVPTALTKRVELRVQFQWFLGAALNVDQTILPSLDAGGDEWEPIAYVAFVYPDGENTATGANQGKVIDVARRVEGLVGGWRCSDAPADSVAGIASALSARLASACSPDSGSAAGGAIAGSAFAEIDGERALVSIAQDFRQFTDVDATDGSSPGDWDLVHYYLCPMQSSFRRRWPLKTLLNATFDADRSHVARGLIVGSTIQPTRQRKNSAPITLHSAGGGLANWAAMDAIPSGAAQYICSGHAWGTAAFNRIYPMVRSAGGVVLYAIGEENFVDPTTYVRWLCPAVDVMGSYTLPGLNVLDRRWTLDLRDIVPRTASVVLLHFEALNNSDFDHIAFEVRNRVDNSANAMPDLPGNPSAMQGQRLAQAMMAAGGGAAFNHPSCDVRIPTGWVPTNGHNDATVTPAGEYHFYLQLRVWSPDAVSSSPKVMAETHIRVLGWEE